MAATKEKKTIRLVFSYCEYTQEIKLNTKQQIAIILTKKNDIGDKIAIFVTLYWVENFML